MSPPASQISQPEKLEGGNVKDDRLDPQLTPNQLSQEESNFGDSSEPLFSVYSKAAEEEDKKKVESWQKDAEGLLIFTGLFSAAVAVLLAVTVQDLRPNSQDISAFHLGNIYEVLADPNATRASIPSPVAEPPPFSPPRYAIWVNSLWFLSLVISLTCALLATSLQQWARRYIRLTQPVLCNPEKRARMHAFFAEGADEMYIPWVVEGLPTLLHLSLFLFFGGLVIFLFNIGFAVFSSVVWWIGLCVILYGWITVMPIVRHDSPYCAPLSRLAWFLYAGMRLVFTEVLSSKSIRSRNRDAGQRFRILKDRYRGWMSGGVERAAEEMMSERSSEIDISIFDWTIRALGDDYSLEKFFEAIPGFFNSETGQALVRDFPETVLKAFWDGLDGFMGRTSSSNSVKDVAKARVTICRDIMSVIPCPGHFMNDNLRDHFDQAPVSIERLQAMARWRTNLSGDISDTARVNVTKNLPRIQKRDNRWIALASDVYGISEHYLQDMVALGDDNVLLAALIEFCRRAIRSHFGDWEVLAAFTQFDIRKTIPALRHDFCTLWNEIFEEAKNQGSFSTPIDILHEIRHLYIALHRYTPATPTAFCATTDDFDHVLFHPSSYPSCNIASHCLEPTARTPVTNSRTVPFSTQPGDSPYAPPHHFTLGDSTALRLAEKTNTIAGLPWPSDQTTTGEIGERPQAPTAVEHALPAHINPIPIHESPPGAVAAALPDIPSTPTSHSLEGGKRHDIVVPCVERDIGGFSSTGSILAPASTLVPTPISSPPVLKKPFASWDAGTASSSNSLLPAASIGGFATPDSRPPSRISPLHSANLIALLSRMTQSHPIDCDTPPRSGAPGLVNSENNSFVNTVLRPLAHCPPFWNLFRDLDKLTGQRVLGEGQETGGGATPLVDATIKFLDEVVYKEEQSVTRQSRHGAASGRERVDEQGKKEHGVVDSFNPKYMYDAMREKRQLKNLLDGKHQDAEEFLDLYLDALDEELVELHAYISTHKPISAPNVEKLGERAQSTEGQTEVDYTGTVETPISRLFGGRSRSTVRAPNQPDTITAQDWRLLQLNIQPDSVHTVEDALAHIPQSQPQPLQVGQLRSSEASEQVQIEKLPSVLVLHLKRFMYDAAVDGTFKISKSVQFAPELEIPLEVMSPASGKAAETVHYKLYGVLYHHGESAGSGHYTVDVLHNGGGGGGDSWLHIGDEAVNVLQHEEVFAGHGDRNGDDRCAYMLFYSSAQT